VVAVADQIQQTLVFQVEVVVVVRLILQEPPTELQVKAILVAKAVELIT
jgi:hypothetical protein